MVGERPYYTGYQPRTCKPACLPGQGLAHREQHPSSLLLMPSSTRSHATSSCSGNNSHVQLKSLTFDTWIGIGWVELTPLWGDGILVDNLRAVLAEMLASECHSCLFNLTAFSLYM